MIQLFQNFVVDDAEIKILSPKHRLKICNSAVTCVVFGLHFSMFLHLSAEFVKVIDHKFLTYSNV